MLKNKFYSIIDSEISKLVDINKEDQAIKRHKETNSEQRKSYAFLIWFLEFYGQKPLYKNYITDGKGDFSCDIIFSNTDSQNQTIFYVVQSKWVKLVENKALESINSDEFGKTLNDFTTILSGTKQNTENEKFNAKYKELLDHLEKNGKVKFIFFTLATFNESIQDSIYSFNKNYSPNISLEVIDIQKIRKDYIEFKFKQILSNNPLEYTYDPEESLIELPIERFEDSIEEVNDNEKKSYLNKRDFLEFHGRAKAYIFLIKPKAIYDLFEKFKFNLFFKNVRNPIHESNYNKKIVETLLKKPSAFWYYNNGLTAITKIIPEIGIHAKMVKLNGLQIINGAQTVYSIYQAYKNANYNERLIMDSDAKISLRLIRSSDEDFNLEITRFTNSQNPMNDRDFVANHDVQQRIQNESFNTSVWYEKREGEFRLEDKSIYSGILIVPNSTFAFSYLAFFMQNPFNATKNNYFFISRKEDSEGLYDEIFNENTKFEDLFASFYMWQLFIMSYGNKNENGTRNIPLIDMQVFILALAFSNIVLTRYLYLKYPNFHKNLNLSLLIKRAIEDKDLEKTMLFRKVEEYALKKVITWLHLDNESELKKVTNKLSVSNEFYLYKKEEFETLDFGIEDIDSIEIE